jgi:hypothetical protein
MARFNLDEYETVEERLKRFHSDHREGAIITENLTQPSDRVSHTWVVRASVYFDYKDQELNMPRGTGMAFEIDGTPGANQTSALENAETSAIGRALANCGYSGNKRPSREEMAKAKRGAPPLREIDWAARIALVTTKTQARQLYAEAMQKHANQDVLALIEEKAAKLPE